MKIACVIPAWNEARSPEKTHLPQVINGLTGHADLIIIVEDGSDDFTYEVARKLPVDLLHHSVNRGQGAALKTGTVYALEQGADIIIHFDADGQFRIEDIEKMVSPLIKDEADAVFGSRFLDNTTVMPAFKKNIIMPVARLINRFLFGVRFTDPQSGFRALNRQAAQQIKWSQDRMAHCSEILINAHQSGLRIKEVPITVFYHKDGRGISEGFNILRDFFLAKLH